MRPLDVDRIEAAGATIDPVFLGSPLIGSPSLNERLGVDLHCKVECLNPIRSFKGRGAECFVAEAAERTSALVCASAGNFGQGLAYAGARRGLAVTVFAAETANPLKVEAMRRLGAQVKLIGADFDAAKDAARNFAREADALFVEDGAEPAIAEGAGTIAREVTEAGLAVRSALVPLGNGALATGVGAWFKRAAPGTELVGVVAAGAPSMLQSFEAGRPVPTSSAVTVADGIAVREPVPYAVASMATLIDHVVAVGEEVIVQAMRLVHEHLGIVVEPAGAVGVAAIVADPERWRGHPVMTVLCGGNVTPEQMRRWLL